MNEKSILKRRRMFERRNEDDLYILFGDRSETTAISLYQFVSYHLASIDTRYIYRVYNYI